MAFCTSLDKKPFALFNRISPIHYYILCVLLICTAKSSHGNIITITRLPNQDDTFDVMSDQGLLCSSNVCSKYKANQEHSGISDSCLCRCRNPLSTFYSKTYTCMESKDVVFDNGCSIKFKDASLGTLPVLDIFSTSGTLRLENKMSDSCSTIQTSWFYLKNSTWIQGKNGIFSVTLKQHWRPENNKWFLKWYTGLHSNYTGIIIKVVVTCEGGTILEPKEQGCLMFKTQGTYKVKQANIIPTKIPQISTTTATKPSQNTTNKPKTESSTDYQPTKVSTNTQEGISTSTISPTHTTAGIPNKPKNKKASSVDQKLWIAFAAGGVTVFFVLIACLVFFFLMIRQRKKQTELQRNSSSRTENANDPLHDYEYVVYPVLTEGYNSSSTRSIDNAMYGRGPDNELIIRTPGVSIESLATNSLNRIRDGYQGNRKSSSAYYSRDITPPINHVANMSHTIGNTSHEYAELQRKEDDVVDSTSGIYQPLIRPATPDTINDVPGEFQAMSLEPINANDREYMVLEPAGPSNQDLNV